MSWLHTYSYGDLLHDLRKQYPGTDSTWSPCVACQKSARGGGYCADCLGDELLRRGLSRQSLNTLRAALQKQAAARSEVEMAFADCHIELKGN